MIESHESKGRYQDVMWIDMALKRKKINEMRIQYEAYKYMRV